LASQLRSQIEWDIDNVIFEDFGEMHLIDGCEVLAIFEKDTSKLLNDRFRHGFDGSYEVYAYIHARVRDLVRLPVEGDICEVDGLRYSVISATDDCGLAIILLGSDVG
jgi:hypothetical protein